MAGEEEVMGEKEEEQGEEEEEEQRAITLTHNQTITGFPGIVFTSLHNSNIH